MIVPALVVASVFSRIATLQKQEFNKNAYEIRQLDRQCEALAPEVLKLGPAAAPPLLAVARDGRRPEKERLLAASFLGLLNDPAAFLPLRELALSAGPDDLRSSAISSLEGAGVDRPALRSAVCSALAQPDLPPRSAAEALKIAARTGCDDAKVLHAWAERFGAHPAARQAELASLTHEALARSFPLEAGRQLWGLFRFYPPGSAQRLSVLNALWEGRATQKQLGFQAQRASQEALRSEWRSAPNSEASLRLAAYLGGAAASQAIRPMLGHPDGEVAVAAAEALARLEDAGSRALLDTLLAGALSDKRLVPGGGRPVRWDLVDRLKKAARSLDPQAPSPY